MQFFTIPAPVVSRLCLLTAGLFAFATLDALADEKPATLKDAYKDYFKVGTAISRSITSGRGFRRTPEQVAEDIALVKAQFNQVVAENEMKWGSLHPRVGKDGYDFTASDAFVEFGKANEMDLAGHTLVWHIQTPNWVFEGTHLPPGATATPPPEKPAAETAPAPPPEGAPRQGPGGGGRLGSVVLEEAGASISMARAHHAKNCSSGCASTSTPSSDVTKAGSKSGT